MTKEKTKSYSFNGEINTSYDSWRQWVDDALALCKMLGHEANYYGAGISGKESYRLSPIGGIQRKINNAEKKKDTITGITILSLPETYTSAAFDYIITLSRQSRFTPYITLIVNEGYEMHLDDKVIIETLRRNITPYTGEIYEMDISASPELYAGKANPKEWFKSLKILSTIM